jgi:MFS family permease
VTLAATLRRPGLGRLATGGLASDVGDWMLLVALPLYVLDLTGSAFVTATVFALELAPMLLLAPLAGVIVDRAEPWRLMRRVAVLQALALVPLLAVRSPDDLWLVYAVVVVEAALATAMGPCRTKTAAGLVPAGELIVVNQAVGMLHNVARLVGAPLGGVVLGVGGIGGVVAIDAATFLGIAAVFAVPAAPATRTPLPAPETPRRVVRDWAEGFAIVARTPVLRRAMLIVALAALAQGAFVVLFVLFVVRDLGGTEADVGVLRGAQAAGSIAGGVLLAAVVCRLEPGRLLALSLAAVSALSLMIWNGPRVTTAFAVYVALFVAVGVPALTTMTALLTVLQTHVAPDARGRVLSMLDAVVGGVQACGMLLAGVVGTGAALSTALDVQAGLYLAAAVLARGLAQHTASGSGLTQRRCRNAGSARVLANDA